MKAKKKNNTLKKNRKSFPFWGEKCVLNGTNYLHKFNTLYIQLISFPGMVAKEEVERNGAF